MDIRTSNAKEKLDAAMRGLVESRMETRCDGNWWRITWRGEEALRRIFERIKDGSMM